MASSGSQGCRRFTEDPREFDGLAQQRVGADDVAIAVGQLPLDHPQACEPGADGCAPLLLAGGHSGCHVAQQPAQVVEAIRVEQSACEDAGRLKLSSGGSPWSSGLRPGVLKVGERL